MTNGCHIGTVPFTMWQHRIKPGIRCENVIYIYRPNPIGDSAKRRARRLVGFYH
nr:MAG TPA: hypothetical protein [Caudoviricetes sp.]